MRPRSSHWRQWAPAYLGGAFVLALLGASIWGYQHRAARQAADTWVNATSASTGQTYTVRATVAGARLEAFTLEGGREFRFHNCALPSSSGSIDCQDDNGREWEIEM